MAIYLAKFYPLCSSLSGETAAKKFSLPKFIDGSCRREPDLQSRFPSISALCRCGAFAPRLRVGDIVVYATCKGTYGRNEPHWRLVAILRVNLTLTHATAADWYREHGIEFPSNCMVENNAPEPLSKTNRANGACAPGCGGDVESWDAKYWERSKRWPVFLVCEAEQSELSEPPAISDEDNHRSFNGKFSQRGPVELTPEELASLRRCFRRSA